jgi:hypothetical protein
MKIITNISILMMMRMDLISGIVETKVRVVNNYLIFRFPCSSNSKFYKIKNGISCHIYHIIIYKKSWTYRVLDRTYRALDRTYRVLDRTWDKLIFTCIYHTYIRTNLNIYKNTLYRFIITLEYNISSKLCMYGMDTLLFILTIYISCDDDTYLRWCSRCVRKLPQVSDHDDKYLHTKMMIIHDNYAKQ